jgi:hypothetical protein
MNQYEALVWIVAIVCTTILSVCFLYTMLRVAEYPPPSQAEEYAEKAEKAEMDDDWP